MISKKKEEDGKYVTENICSSLDEFVTDIIYKATSETEDFYVSARSEFQERDYVDSSCKYNFDFIFTSSETEMIKMRKILEVRRVNIESEYELSDWIKQYLETINKGIEKQSEGIIKSEIEGLRLKVCSLNGKK